MRLYKRGKKWTYDVQWINNQGETKRIRKSGFNSKKEAGEAGLDLERKLKGGLNIAAPRRSFYDFFEKYIDIYITDKVAPATEQSYSETLSSIDKYFPFETIQNITPEDYQKGLNEYAKTHAKSTAKKFHTQIKASVKRGIFNGDIEKDFTQYAVVSGNKEEKKENEKYLSEKDLDKLLDYVETRLDPRYPNPYLIYTTTLTGMRFGEALGLTWNDIDFEHGIIDINKAWDYKRLHTFTKNKTLFSPRKLRVTEDLLDTLKTYQIEQIDLLETKNKTNKHNLVFFSPIDGVPTNDGANTRLKEYLKKLEITPLITMHGLRHTHASVLFRNGISVPTISQRLGHKNTTITYSTYIHIIRELEKDDEKALLKVLEKRKRHN